mmetsp:Transcript_19316/g.26596  ORF Transcript_19316/g.26596 Transcript_19316/m.26596 type:complete len:250 (+) Transcript_19316:322-1071(+)
MFFIATLFFLLGLIGPAPPPLILPAVEPVTEDHAVAGPACAWCRLLIQVPRVARGHNQGHREAPGELERPPHPPRVVPLHWSCVQPISHRSKHVILDCKHGIFNCPCLWCANFWRSSYERNWSEGKLPHNQGREAQKCPVATGEDGEPRPGQVHSGLGQPLRPQQTLHAPDVPQVLQVRGEHRRHRRLQNPPLVGGSQHGISKCPFCFFRLDKNYHIRLNIEPRWRSLCQINNVIHCFIWNRIGQKFAY